jgi:hypothetical protein
MPRLCKDDILQLVNELNIGHNVDLITFYNTKTPDTTSNTTVTLTNKKIVESRPDIGLLLVTGILISENHSRLAS